MTTPDNPQSEDQLRQPSAEDMAQALRELAIKTGATAISTQIDGRSIEVKPEITMNFSNDQGETKVVKAWMPSPEDQA